VQPAKCAAVALGMLLVTSVPTDAMLRRGDVIVSQLGGLVRLDPATGVTVRLDVTPPLTNPVGVVVLPDGDLLVADWISLLQNDGFVFRVDLRTRTATPLTPPGALPNPMGLVRGPDGRIVLADIDAGSPVVLPSGTVLRKGMLFDFDATTGAFTPLVHDCCDFNPVQFVFAGPTDVLVTDAGCCGYSGPGAIAHANLSTGAWETIPTDVAWRDPFGLALSADGDILWVAESAFVEAGLPAIRAVDLDTGTTATVLEGAPLDTPIGLLTEADGALLIADRGADTVFRLTLPTVVPDVVAAGPPFEDPNNLVAYDAGDVVGGLMAHDPGAAACAARARRAETRLVTRSLRCITREIGLERTDCLARATELAQRAAPGFDCQECMATNRRWVAEELPDALTRTPGQRFDCAGDDIACRNRLGRATGKLYGALARCDSDFMASATLDRTALDGCRAAAKAQFDSRASRCMRCTAGDRDVIAAQIASLIDGFVGAWFCAR
jgi:hypothetical protein